jgi:hypothetical protein
VQSAIYAESTEEGLGFTIEQLAALETHLDSGVYWPLALIPELAIAQADEDLAACPLRSGSRRGRPVPPQAD